MSLHYPVSPVQQMTAPVKILARKLEDKLQSARVKEARQKLLLRLSEDATEIIMHHYEMLVIQRHLRT
jgi:hypothetical protein